MNCIERYRERRNYLVFFFKYYCPPPHFLSLSFHSSVSPFSPSISFPIILSPFPSPCFFFLSHFPPLPSFSPSLILSFRFQSLFTPFPFPFIPLPPPLLTSSPFLPFLSLSSIVFTFFFLLLRFPSPFLLFFQFYLISSFQFLLLSLFPPPPPLPSFSSPPNSILYPPFLLFPTFLTPSPFPYPYFPNSEGGGGIPSCHFSGYAPAILFLLYFLTRVIYDVTHKI